LDVIRLLLLQSNAAQLVASVIVLQPCSVGAATRWRRVELASLRISRHLAVSAGHVPRHWCGGCANQMTTIRRPSVNIYECFARSGRVFDDFRQILPTVLALVSLVRAPLRRICCANFSDACLQRTSEYFTSQPAVKPSVSMTYMGSFGRQLEWRPIKADRLY